MVKGGETSNEQFLAFGGEFDGKVVQMMEARLCKKFKDSYVLGTFSFTEGSILDIEARSVECKETWRSLFAIYTTPEQVMNDSTHRLMLSKLWAKVLQETPRLSGAAGGWPKSGEFAVCENHQFSKDDVFRVALLLVSIGGIKSVKTCIRPAFAVDGKELLQTTNPRFGVVWSLCVKLRVPELVESMHAHARTNNPDLRIPVFKVRKRSTGQMVGAPGGTGSAGAGGSNTASGAVAAFMELQEEM